MRIAILGLAWVALAGACGETSVVPGNTNEESSATRHFVDEQLGIALNYPADWRATTQPFTRVVWPPQRLAVASFSLDRIEPEPNCSPTPA